MATCGMDCNLSQGWFTCNCCLVMCTSDGEAQVSQIISSKSWVDHAGHHDQISVGLYYNFVSVQTAPLILRDGAILH